MAPRPCAMARCLALVVAAAPRVIALGRGARGCRDPAPEAARRRRARRFRRRRRNLASSASGVPDSEAQSRRAAFSRTSTVLRAGAWWLCRAT